MFSLLQDPNNLLVLAQASAGDTNSLVGWILVAVLAAIFAGFVISILRTKPIDPATVETTNELATQEVAVENRTTTDRDEISSSVKSGVSSAVKEQRYTTPEPAAPKMKGLKGKKKQQKKKLNAQRGTTPLAPQADSSAKRDEEVAAQPRIADYTPNLTASSSGLDEGALEDRAESESADDSATAVEPVRLASTYAINAMANKPRLTSKPKESSKKKSQAKGAVQGFHKMDRYREQIRTVDVPITTFVAPRSDLQSFVGGEEEVERKNERRERRPKREPARPIQNDAEAPRTLKDFLTQKPEDE